MASPFALPKHPRKRLSKVFRKVVGSVVLRKVLARLEIQQNPINQPCSKHV
jgi:hypothetical protein